MEKLNGMMSLEMKKYYELATKIGEGLTESFHNKMVIVAGRDDESHIMYDSAIIQVHDDWYLVFTEHYGHHVFHKDSYFVTMWDRVYFAGGE